MSYRYHRSQSMIPCGCHVFHICPRIHIATLDDRDEEAAERSEKERSDLRSNAPDPIKHELR